jgi:hypothetical protein
VPGQPLGLDDPHIYSFDLREDSSILYSFGGLPPGREEHVGVLKLAAKPPA